MAKPYVHWDVSVNAELLTNSLDGPLIVEVSQSATISEIERFKMLIAPTTRPVLFDDEIFGYQQFVRYMEKDAQHRGVGVTQSVFLPNNMTFSIPGADPFDLSDAYLGQQFRLLNTGFRMSLRGWIGTMFDSGMNGQFVVEWRDEQLRAASDLRASWTGMTIGVSNRNNGRIDHLFDILHGKRFLDSDWVYHGGHLDRVPGGPEVTDENTTVGNTILNARFRTVISGGAPLWHLSFQRFDGLNWIEVHAVDVDFRSHISGDIGKVALIMSLFSSSGINQIPPLPADLEWQNIWANYFEMSQFEPWVIDVAEWSERSWDEHWRWLTGTSKSYSIELRRPPTDLMHMPIGSNNAPEEIRASDPDMGICIRMNRNTVLSAVGISDDRYVDPDDGPSVEPICVCDADMYGKEAPFAAYAKMKLTSLDAVNTERTIFSFGDAYNPTPSLSDNGIGLIWRPTSDGMGRLVGICFDQISGVVEIVSDEIACSDFSDRVIELGIAWTGSRGTSIGRSDNEFRIVVDGKTLSAQIVDDFYLSGTFKAYVGSDETKDTCPSLMREMVLFGDAITDYELDTAFSIAENDVLNPSFETADDSGRPGEAAFWSWVSVQKIGGWAEFNSYSPILKKWRTALEMFGPGWENIINWIYSFDDTQKISALFNGGSERYQAIFEMFEVWRKLWTPGFEWSGPPWRDDFLFVDPAHDTVGPGNGPTGFNGWYDSMFGTNYLPMTSENFGEGIGTDPFSDFGGATWYSGSGIDGYIEGSPLPSEINILPDKNRFVIWTDLNGAMEISLTAGTYDIDSLISHLNSILASYYSSNPLGLLFFDKWERDDKSGLKFGIGESSVLFLVSAASLFGIREDSRSRDARETLGLVGYGPGGIKSDFRATREMLGELHGGDYDDIFCLDSWSLLEFTQVLGSGLSGKTVLSYGSDVVLFDDSTPAVPIDSEIFALVPWTFSGATWFSGFESGETPGPSGLLPGLFESELTLSSFEKFFPENWEDEIW